MTRFKHSRALSILAATILVGSAAGFAIGHVASPVSSASADQAPTQTDDLAELVAGSASTGDKTNVGSLRRETATSVSLSDGTAIATAVTDQGITCAMTPLGGGCGAAPASAVPFTWAMHYAPGTGAGPILTVIATRPAANVSATVGGRSVVIPEIAANVFSARIADSATSIRVTMMDGQLANEDLAP